MRTPLGTQSSSVRLRNVLGALVLIVSACAPSAPAAPTTAPAAAPTTAPAAAAKPAAAAGDVVIGAVLPLTGPLAPFGANIRIGYQSAVDAVNKAGGLDVGGTKRQVSLVILDDQSDPNMATDQARTLIQRNNAVALLGSATPPLNIPISNVADQLKRPLIIGACPIRAWLSGKPDGWQFSWDMFFDELQMTDLQYQTSDLAQTNKKVALFTDTEEDGVVMGDLWEQKAPKAGYEIAYHAKFPVGTTNFSSQIDAAKSAQAQVLIAQMIPPDAFALWKQMKALNYQPVVAFCEKCGNSSAWHQVLADVGEGPMPPTGGRLHWATPRARPSSTRIPRNSEASVRICRASWRPTRRPGSCWMRLRRPARPRPKRSMPPLPRPTRPTRLGRSSSGPTTRRA